MLNIYGFVGYEVGIKNDIIDLHTQNITDLLQNINKSNRNKRNELNFFLEISMVGTKCENEIIVRDNNERRKPQTKNIEHENVTHTHLKKLYTRKNIWLEKFSRKYIHCAGKHRTGEQTYTHKHIFIRQTSKKTYHHHNHHHPSLVSCLRWNVMCAHSHTKMFRYTFTNTTQHNTTKYNAHPLLGTNYKI